MDARIWLALGLTLFAGLPTGIGSALAFFAKRTNYRFLSWATGFSAGVMIYVSFVEILSKASDSLGGTYGRAAGNWLTAASSGLSPAALPHPKPQTGRIQQGQAKQPVQHHDR